MFIVAISVAIGYTRSKIYKIKTFEQFLDGNDGTIMYPLEVALASWYVCMYHFPYPCLLH